MLSRAIVHAWRLARNAPLLFKYRDATMVRKVVFLENLIIAARALQRPELAGSAVVECGTWKGGMAAALWKLAGRTDDIVFLIHSRVCRPLNLSTERQHWNISKELTILLQQLRCHYRGIQGNHRPNGCSS